MLAWMAYSTLAAALLVAAGAVLEQFSPWLANKRRLAWLTVIASSLSFMIAAALPTARSAPEAPVLSPGPKPVVHAPATSVIGSPVTVSAAPTIEQSRAARPAASSAQWDIVLVVLWLAGSVMCIGVLAVSSWRVARMRRGWREGVVAGVPVLVSHDVGPAVIGLVHHGIVVPSWVEHLETDDQKTVMTHEREHVRAGDPLLLWSATLLVSLAPWNPALWYALRRLRHAIEIDCDARVLRSRPDARAYCTLLLDVGERTLAGVAPVAALAEPATLLERRIDAMTSPVRARRGWAVASVIAAVMLVTAACFAPRPQIEPRARVLALASELGVLLSRDSVQRSLTPADRERIARDMSPRTEAAISNQYGQRVVELARTKFPEAFDRSDDAAIVTVIFDADDKVVLSDFRRLPLADVFDLANGSSGKIVGMRAGRYLLSRVITRQPNLWSSGTQMQITAPHTVFAFARLMPGQPIPKVSHASTAVTFRDVTPTAGSTRSYSRIVEVPFAQADSIARALYPSAYTPHDGVELVGLIFSSTGQLLRATKRVVNHDDVFLDAPDGTSEPAKGGDELLPLLFTDLPASIRHWTTTAHRADIAPAIVWLVLAPSEGIPTPRTDAPEPPQGPRAGSPAHATAHVTLTPLPSTGDKQSVLVYSTNGNGVESGMRGARSRIDTFFVGVPSTLSLTLNPGANLHFVSLDGKEFHLSAYLASRATVLSNHGVHMVLEKGGMQLRTNAP